MAKLGFYEDFSKLFIAIFIITAILAVPIAGAFELDKSKYFAFDDVKPDMDAYCLSVISGTKIEKFPLKVISPIKNFRPGRNIILVVGTDDTFKKIGAVRGCSGSPVYIDNKMVGALSAGYPMAKDPLYHVTPIEEMLTIGTSPENNYHPDKLSIDFSKPIDLNSAYQQFKTGIKTLSQNSTSRNNPLAVATSLPQNACAELADILEPIGMMPISYATSTSVESSDSDNELNSPYQPGGILSLPLVSGDISISGVGTITEVIGDTVYGFGHDFLGYGSLEVPMATGYIHTVIASNEMSFKLGSAGPISGTLVFDESTGVVGKIGQKPKLIPLCIKVNRFNDIQERTYNCELLYNEIYSPSMVQSVISGAGLMKGTLPNEHSVSYKLKVGLDGFDPIIFEDVSTGSGLRELTVNAVGFVSMLMSNPFEQVDITSIDIEMSITAKDTQAHIYSVEISDKTLKAGDSVDLNIALERYKAPKSYYTATVEIPDDTQPGQYSIIVAGGSEYEQILQNLTPHKYTAYSLPTMIDAIHNISTIKHNKIFLVMQLPPKGVTIMEKELPDLPTTKMLLLANPKRSTEIKPYNHWIETSINTDMVISGGREIKIIVEE